VLLERKWHLFDLCLTDAKLIEFEVDICTKR